MGTLTLWHGGNLDKDYTSPQKGKWEYGPGLYLTTHYDTAKKYAKGSRKLYKVVISEGHNINDVFIPLDNIKEFVTQFLSKAKQKEFFTLVEKYIKDDKVNADIFLNLLINHYVLNSKYAPELRDFLVENGVDYCLVDSPFGWGELMVVLFNMNKILFKQQITAKDKIEDYDLPTKFSAQIKKISLQLKKAKLGDWKNTWVRYTNNEQQFINLKPWHRDPLGLYFFPEEFKTQGSWHLSNKFKVYAKLNPSANVLDLGALNQEDCQDILTKLGIDKEVKAKDFRDRFWEILTQTYYTNTAKFANDLRKLGYDAVFDDTDSIFHGEVQLLVLDPKYIEIYDIENLEKPTKFIHGMKDSVKNIMKDWKLISEKWSKRKEYRQQLPKLDLVYINKEGVKTTVSLTISETHLGDKSPTSMWAKCFLEKGKYGSEDYWYSSFDVYCNTQRTDKFEADFKDKLENALQPQEELKKAASLIERLSL